MRKLISQFKRSPYSNPKPFIVCCLLVTTLGAAVNCSVKRDPAGQWHMASLEEMVHQLTGSTSSQIEIYVQLATNTPSRLGSLNAAVCDADVAQEVTQQWTIPITSPYRKWQAKVTIPASKSKESGISIELDGIKMLYTGAKAPSHETLANICGQWQAGNSADDGKPQIWLSDVSTLDAIQAWLSSVAPQCQFDRKSPTASGWACSLPTIAATAASKTLSHLQTRMIRKWSRHPYLLTRRLAISRKLAKVLETKENTDGLRKFCKVIDSSLASELPVHLANSRWQAAVCQNNSPERFTNAAEGLAGAVKELEFLHNLVEETSRLGLLQIKIPSTLAPSRTLWVRLKPLTNLSSPPPPKDENKSKTKATPSLSLEEASSNITENARPAQSCWHPLFSQIEKTHGIARRLGLVTGSSDIVCADSAAEEQGTPVVTERPEITSEEYLIQSITGESEFLITNGNAKILRLPKGNYSYTIHGIPKNRQEWQPSDTDAMTSGSISWLKRRPQPLIKTW